MRFGIPLITAVLLSQSTSAALTVGPLSYQSTMISFAQRILSFYWATGPSQPTLECRVDSPGPPTNLTEEIRLTQPGFLPPNAPVPYLDDDSIPSSHPPESPLTLERMTDKAAQLPRITNIAPDGMFIDATGATRLFRGLSVSFKGKPYLPPGHAFDPLCSFSDEDFRLFDKLNLNIIRLGVSWSAVQPHPGSHGFDNSHLSQLKAFVEKCGRHGIYVLVEAHQDIFSEKFNGDGFPAWAATTDPTTWPFPIPMRGWKKAHYDSDGRVDNIAYTDLWAVFHGSDEVTRAFWGLYTDFEGVQGEFERFWVKLAGTFAGMDNVIGYGEFEYPILNVIWLIGSVDGIQSS